MNLRDLDLWCQSALQIAAFAAADNSMNGIQVQRSDGPLSRVAFAVDACAESMRRAAEAGAQVLFVHHGIFWGRPLRVEGNHYRRLKRLIEADLALYACHLPLDAHAELGNNAVMARLLGLEEKEPFGLYKGLKIGWKGRLPAPLALDAILARLGDAASSPRCIIPAGRAQISTVALISGGAADESREAIEEGIDLYITGEPSHSVYNEVVEAKLNFVALGHYATETFGVRAVAERLALETGLETRFIDLPTGL